MRRDNQRVVVTEYESGTLLLQGRASDLFEEVCVVLDSAFSQSFAKRGARYAPDPERQVLLDHLHRPHTEQRALQWGKCQDSEPGLAVGESLC
jgi:hypothetical protein